MTPKIALSHSLNKLSSRLNQISGGYGVAFELNAKEDITPLSAEGTAEAVNKVADNELLGS